MINILLKISKSKQFKKHFEKFKQLKSKYFESHLKKKTPITNFII